ncbi:MAG: YdjY domain-containing protein [Pirellulaceae bacterium]
MRRFFAHAALFLNICLGVLTTIGQAQTPPRPSSPSAGSNSPAAPSEASAGKPAPGGTEGLGDFTALVRLSRDYDVWIDTRRKVVVVDGNIALREGLLEMFACPKGTKEHESIVAVNCNAQFVHAGLIAVGAEPGSPVAFAPEYKAATGPVIDVWVLWKDERGQSQKVKAQEWILQTKTNKTMEYPWVFAGSAVTVDEQSGKKYYLADGGDFICVSNFTSAMLDLPVESSQSNSDLSFRANTPRIPPLGTAVRLVLEPRPAAPAPKGKPSAGNSSSPTPKR